jgi:uncharacterized protein YjdB
MSTFKQFALLAITVGSGVFLAGCEPKLAKAPVQPDLVSIALSPSMATVQIGATQALSVTGTFSNYSTANLTNASIFLTSNPQVALVSAAGVVTAKKAGTATITATHTASGKTATATITVPAPTLVSIAITPRPVNLVAGTTQQLTVTGTYSDASTAPLTTGLTFSPNNAYATVSNSGLVTAVAAGTTTVTATDTASGFTDTVDVIVTAASGGGGWPTITFDEVPPPTLTDFGTNGAGASIVTDPAGGTNKVLKINKYALPAPGSEQWAGTTVSLLTGDMVAPIPFTASAKTMTVRVYSPAVGVRVRLKVENAANPGISCETDAITTMAGAWEVLTFDFANPGLSPPVGGGPTSPLDVAQTYNRISIFMDFGLGNGGSGPLPADRIYYADDITFGSGGSCGSTDPTCAPTTVIPAGAVTIYSDAASVAGLDSCPNWGQATVCGGELTIAGNKTLKYSQLNYQGLDWSANPVDVSTKGKLHIDFWTPDLTSVKVSIISAGLENAVTQVLTTGNWNSVDIDLSNYTVPNLAAIIQIKLESATPGTLYVDNIYFWGTAAGASCGTTDPTCAPNTVIPAGAVTIYSDAASVAGLDSCPNWGQATVCGGELTIAGNKTLKYSQLNYQGLDWSANPVNVSAKGKLHIDFWTPDLTSVKVSIISAGKENAFTQTLTTKSWNSADIDLTNYTVPDLTAIIQIKLESATPGTLYVDNIYFWGTAAGGGGGAVVSNVFSAGALDTGVVFHDFGGAVNVPAPAIDAATLFTDGSAALKVVVTGQAASYSGGAWVASAPRDLRAANAVVFWAKASQAQSTLKVQLGNDAGAGANVDYQVESIGLPLTTNWQQFAIPLPDPAKANGIDGLLSFADANNNYTFWLAKVQYVTLPGNVLGTGFVAGDGFNAVPLSGNPPSISIPVSGTYGINPGPNSLVWTLGSAAFNGSPLVPLPNGGNLNNDAWRWFTLASSNLNVATVDAGGLITGVAAGTATITGTLAGTAIPGNVPVTVTAPLGQPMSNAPTPVLPQGNVIAMFDSHALYVQSPIDNLNENWCGAGATEAPYAIPGGTTVLNYVLPNCTGIGFESNPINVTAAGMTSFHMDIWTPDPVALQLQLVDAAGGGVGSYTPALAANVWNSIDVPISSFTGLTGTTALQQIGFINGGVYTVLYIDNIYFHT